VTVIDDYGHVDIQRFCHINGNPEYVLCAALNGVSINFDEWAHLLQLVPTIQERHPVFAESCDKEKQ